MSWRRRSNALSGLAGLVTRPSMLVWFGGLLTWLYAVAYLANPDLPGNSAAAPAGWTAWWDQSHSMTSAMALAHSHLSAELHLYPLGYAVLGAVFAPTMPMHAFFFVDLASLLIAFVAFVSVARRCGMAPLWGCVIFILAVRGDRVLFDQWVIPWSTTPTAAVLWVLLAVAAAHMEGVRRPLLLGLIAACVPLLRPTDSVLAVPALVGCLLVDLRHRRLHWRDPALAVAGAALVVVPYGALHVAIYGWRLSDYMTHSADIGFTLHGLGWKAYVILLDPRDWIGGGMGLVPRLPWLVLGIAGLVPAVRRPVPAMLAITLLIHAILYLAYVDLLPSGFWRYKNVHYWVWAFPGFALLAVLLVRDALAPAGRWLPIGAVVAVVLLLCVRLEPRVARPGESVDALDYQLPTPGFDAAYFAEASLTDSFGVLTNVYQIRALPMEFGVRVLTLKRPIEGPVRAHGLDLESLTPVRLHAAFQLGLPPLPFAKPDAVYGPR